VENLVRAVEAAIGAEGIPTELAGAKINLALHVTGRRADGYHLIESLVAFADYGDVVGARPASDGRMRLVVKGPLAEALDKAAKPADNLVIRAATELTRAAGPRARLPAMKLFLLKRLPIAAGLGGGSADAAATLRLLDRLWQLDLGEAKLAEIALTLGADVPMCLQSRPLLARGIGERLTPVLGMPALPVVLVQPRAALSTTAVFARLAPGERTPLPPLPARFKSLLEVIFWLRQARNDLAEPAAAVSKSAATAAKALMRDPDCLFARMSGSGAAAFGIFASMKAAERAAARIAERKVNWWIAPVMTRAS
jgi:4-diphosphocytidyl-2-C-methyl-D-erythritol kinase